MSVNVAQNPTLDYWECSLSGATNASPIVVTGDQTGTGYVPQAGDYVQISGVSGNTAANGVWEVANPVDTYPTFTIELVGSTGNGAYGAGGTLIHYRIAADASNRFHRGASGLPDSVSPYTHTADAQNSCFDLQFGDNDDVDAVWAGLPAAGDLSAYEGTAPEFTVRFWVKANAFNDAGPGTFYLRIELGDDSSDKVWDSGTSAWVNFDPNGETKTSAALSISAANTWQQVSVTLTAFTLGTNPYLFVNVYQPTVNGYFGSSPYDGDPTLENQVVCFDDYEIVFPDASEAHSDTVSVSASSDSSVSGSPAPATTASVSGTSSMSITPGELSYGSEIAITGGGETSVTFEAGDGYEASASVAVTTTATIAAIGVVGTGVNEAIVLVRAFASCTACGEAA